MTLGPAKHEKVARLGRISNVLGLREHKVRSNPLVSWGKIPFDPNIIIYIRGNKCDRFGISPYQHVFKRQIWY